MYPFKKRKKIIEIGLIFYETHANIYEYAAQRGLKIPFKDTEAGE